MSKIDLYQGDYRDWLPSFPARHFKMLFADPPDNVGLGYGGYDDNLDRASYRKLLKYILDSTYYTDILFISYNAKHMSLMGHILEEGWYNDYEFEVRNLVQYISFGYCSQKDFSYCFRPIVRIMRKGVETYPDAVRIESDRQKQGDKRADPRGKIPGDVWPFHRVTGNSRQRRRWHPTQLNEALYERCLDFSCERGDAAGDLFAGTGSMGRAATDRGLDISLFEISETYCGKLADEFNIEPKVKTPC